MAYSSLGFIIEELLPIESARNLLMTRLRIRLPIQL